MITVNCDYRYSSRVLRGYLLKCQLDGDNDTVTESSADKILRPQFTYHKKIRRGLLYLEGVNKDVCDLSRRLGIGRAMGLHASARFDFSFTSPVRIYLSISNKLVAVSTVSHYMRVHLA